MSKKIRIGQYVHVSRAASDYPPLQAGKTKAERDISRQRVPSSGVVIFVGQLAPWATVLLYDVRGPVPRAMYCESFGLDQLNATRPPRGVTP